MCSHFADNSYKTFLPCFLGMGKGTLHTEEGLHHHLILLPALSLFHVLIVHHIYCKIRLGLQAASLYYCH